MLVSWPHRREASVDIYAIAAAHIHAQASEVLGYVLGFRGPAQGVFFDDKRIRNGEGTTLHALDRVRGGTADRYVCKDAYHPIHVANAWDDETSGCPSMIAACWPPGLRQRDGVRQRDITRRLGTGSSEAISRSVAVTQLVLFRGHGGGAEARVLCSGAHLDHCKVHPAVGGLANKFVYASAGAAVARGDVDDATYAAPQPPQAFVRVDVSEDAVVDAWFCGERRFTDDAVLAATGKDEPTRSSSHRYMPRRDAAVYDCGPRLWCGHGVLLGTPSTRRFFRPRRQPRRGTRLRARPARRASIVPWGLHGAWSLVNLLLYCAQQPPPPRAPHAELVRREEVAHGPLYHKRAHHQLRASHHQTSRRRMPDPRRQTG